MREAIARAGAAGRTTLDFEGVDKDVPTSLKIDALTICNYKPDPTSNTVLNCPLPEMTPQNHKLYAEFTGLNNYIMMDKLILPDREAHYSKMISVHQHLQNNPDVDWAVYVDCDAWFTNFNITIPDIIQTY